MTEAVPVPPRPGPGAPAARLGEILRVDHAGELAAVYIYRGQRAVLNEAEHLAAFNQLLTRRRVRPTLMTPIWRAAAFALGAGTALMGEKAAHACTEAVETVIEKHYAGQIAELQSQEPALAAELSRFRDDELAHRDLAVSEGARAAPFYPLLSAVIAAGCRTAIKISEKL